MMKHTVKWISRAILALVILILLILVLLVGTLSSNLGLNTLISVTQQLAPQLTVEKAQGSVLTGFTLYNATFIDDELKVAFQGEEVSLRIDADCFFHPSICVDQFKLKGVRFSFSGQPDPAAEQQTEPPEPIAEISLPVPLQLRHIELKDIELDVLGNQVNWETFTSALEMTGRTLTIHPTQFEGIRVSLANSDAQESKVEPDNLSPDSGNSQKKQPISLPEVKIPLEIQLTQFNLNRFMLEGETPVIVNNLELSADASEYQLNINKLHLDTPQADVQLQTNIELRNDYPIELNIKSLLKQTDLKGQKLQLHATGSVAKLQLKASLSEQIKAELQSELEPLKPELPFYLTLTETKAQWPLNGEAEYHVQLEKLNLNGSLNGYHIELKSQADGATIPALDLALKGEGDLNQIKLESIQLNTLGGEVAGKVSANWQKPVNWKADLALANIQPGLQWQQAEGVISGSLSTFGELTDKGGWKVALPELDITGIVRDFPLDIKGELTAADLNGSGDIYLMTTGLGVKHGPNGIHMSGKVDKALNLDVAIDLPQIDKTVPDIKGRLDGLVNIQGDIKQPKLQVSLLANEMAYAELATIGTIDLKAEAMPLSDLKSNLKLIVSDVEYQGTQLDTVQIGFSGSPQKHQLDLSILSDLLNSDIHITGGLQETSQPVWKGALSKANLSTQQGTWKLDHSADLEYVIDKQLAKVQAHCWLQDQSKLCLTKDLEAGKAGEVHFEIKNFAFSQVKQFIPDETNIDGKVNVQAMAKWAPESKPNVDVKVILPDGKLIQQLKQPVELGWQSISLNATLANDTLNANWLIDFSDNGEIKGNLNIPDAQAIEQNLNANLVMQNINLDMIQPLIGEYSALGADIHSDITLSGPVRHPRVEGELVINNMIAQGEVTPLEIQSGQFKVNFNGYTAALNANLETPDGTLQVNGDADWRVIESWSTKVKVFAQELKVDAPPMVRVKVKPDLQISVSPTLAKIDGDIYLPWGRIEVKELPPSAISISSDEVILNTKLEPQKSNASIPIEVQTNVNIHIGDDFRLAAMGLKGELVGSVNVSQKNNTPFILGEINIEKGEYRSFGQDLIIEKGKVLMNGPVDQPYLEIEAIRNPDNTQDDVIAGIRVTGPASEPIIDIFSDPFMPQQNALSYLLRGQDIDSGNSSDNSVTTALIGLSLARGGQLVGQIGEAFGVSDLQLDAAGTGDESQVTVSGYITPDLKVKYGVGIFDSLSEFTVRYRLLTDLYLEAVTGVDNAVDLLYQFEFD